MAKQQAHPIAEGEGELGRERVARSAARPRAPVEQHTEELAPTHRRALTRGEQLDLFTLRDRLDELVRAGVVLRAVDVELAPVARRRQLDALT
jgi:hypothetical protein